MSPLGMDPSDIAVAALRQDVEEFRKVVAKDLEMLAGALRGLSVMVGVLVELNGGQEAMQAKLDEMQVAAVGRQTIDPQSNGAATPSGLIIP